MPINPVLTQRLCQVAQAAEAAPHGARQAVYAQACAELGLSKATLHRYLKEVSMPRERKRRADAGMVTLSRDEAILISALLMDSLRKNNKRLRSIGQAVQILRANGEVRAERTDPATGEVVPLSDSAIGRALRHYVLHPDQLLAPAPAVELRSLHPNHVWQVDASLCVLYYLSTSNPREAGLQVMEAKRFYKNKPANLKRIEADRVWRYVVTDHNSGCIYVHYVMGAESGTNLSAAFIAAMQQRDGCPFYGVPWILMMDMGSANTSGLFMNLLRRLDIKPLPHAPENARATGQVEKGQDIVECSLESGLRLQPVANLDELNALGRKWARWYNATQTHSRHGRHRFDQWMTIGQDQLRLAPSAELCAELLTHTPEQRKVTDFLTVSFKGREFDVRSVPGVAVGERLMMALNPWVPDAACVVDTDANGNEVLHTVPVVERDDAGFRADGNVIGEDWKRHAATVADVNRTEVELTTMGVATVAEAEAARKAKALPFGGRIDPYREMTDTPERTYLPRRGTELVPTVTTTRTAAPARVLSLFEVAAELARRGVAMSADRNAQVRTWHPDGVPKTSWTPCRPG
jgi:hypothetical protein